MILTFWLNKTQEQSKVDSSVHVGNSIMNMWQTNAN